jgi:hypothetical protein
MEIITKLRAVTRLGRVLTSTRGVSRLGLIGEIRVASSQRIPGVWRFRLAVGNVSQLFHHMYWKGYISFRSSFAPRINLLSIGMGPRTLCLEHRDVSI